MTLEGYGPYQIAVQLSSEHIPVPAYHQAQLGMGLWQNREFKNPYKWGSSTIAHILQKHEYLGHTVNFKTRKHFKDKKSHYVDNDQWLIFEDTHEIKLAYLIQKTETEYSRKGRNKGISAH